MHRAGSPSCSRLCNPRRLALALGPAWLLLAVGCAQLHSTQAPAVVRGQAPAEPRPARLQAPVVAVQAPAQKPAPPEKPQTLPPPAAEEALPERALPINLDTVLRLAQDQNGQVAIARAKLAEAFAQRDVAAKAWLPDLWVGTSYYRHEGGIQDFNGSLVRSSFGSLFGGAEIHGRFDLREAVFQRVDAERKIWQQKGELSRLTSENLLDATSTYVDLLAARAGEALALGLRKNLQDLLVLAEKLTKIDSGYAVEVKRVRTELYGQDLAICKLREGARKASAKLAYLLGLDPAAELVVMDRQLVPLQLVDASVPVEQLVQQAITNGPGVRELEGLLNLIHETAAKAQGLTQFLPTLDVRAGEGIFGAGPGGSSTWDNRFDLALQARWNLTPLLTARERKEVARAKMQQAHLSMQDLRAKLTLGVQEAHETVRSGADQMGLVEHQIAEATEAYKSSRYRLENVPRTAPSEVLAAIGSLGRAQLSYLQAVRELDKAQLRLLVLLGMGAERCH
jgi:outer membrane protein TolC